MGPSRNGLPASARPHALVVDDNPATLALLSRRLEAVGVVPWATRSPAQALRHLGAQGTPPIVAVVGLDTVEPSRSGRDSAAVLARLFSHFPDCETVAHTRSPTRRSLVQAVAVAHPNAVIHDRRDDLRGVVEWIDCVFSRSVGDLRLEQGLVLHRPTMLVYRHFVGVQLVIRHPRAVTFRGDTTSRAARRFSHWLAEAQSTLTVISHGDWKYRLADL